MEYVTVNSTVGSIKGFVSNDVPNVAQFLGIQFAEAPIGPRRWQLPVPKAPQEHIDATAFGPSCPQVVSGPPSIYNSDAPNFGIEDPTSEDCLSLCIWAPASAAKNPDLKSLPVIVWITGGAFLVGGSTIPYQNPCRWVESSQRHIVVCVNYRLNIFGFPNAAGLPLEQQNLGFYDQRAGLEWVHSHIKAFGGDPDRLTHWGQSAGARSIDVHAFAYLSKPLVRGIIMNSGTALTGWAANDPTHFAFSFVANSLGFPGGSASEELEFMRTIPATTIVNFLTDHFLANTGPVLGFRPMVDEVFVFADSEERTKQGKFSKLPAIIGTVADEGNSLAPYTPDGCDVEISKQITYDYFIKPSKVTTEARSLHAPTFRFLGRYSFSNIAPRPWQRAYHSSDLPLIFGTHELFRGKSTLEQWKVSRAWQEMYVVFAEEGAEGLRAKGWLESSHGKGVIFGEGDEGWKVVDIKEVDGTV